jgi:hypothetical protein
MTSLNFFLTTSLISLYAWVLLFVFKITDKSVDKFDNYDVIAWMSLVPVVNVIISVVLTFIIVGASIHRFIKFIFY